MLHYGLAGEVIERRQKVLDGAYARNPERFVHHRPPTPAPAHRGLDQPANPGREERRNSTLNSRATCLKLVDTFRTGAVQGPFRLHDTLVTPRPGGASIRQACK